MNLFNIPIVQVTISIIISWGLFAIFISLIQESFAQVMAERGRFMKVYLLKQLNDNINGINWGNLVYNHGSIRLLTRAPNKPTNDISPKLFAEVLIEQVSKLHLTGTPAGGKAKNLTLTSFTQSLGALNQSEVISFLQLALNNAESKATTTSAGVNQQEVYDHLVSQIETWYKEFLERLDLWYKKRMRLKLFVIGAILSALINVDSIQLFNYFRVSPESRTAVINYYNHYIADSTANHPSIQNYPSVTRQSLDSLVQVADLPVGFDFSIFKVKPVSAGSVWWKLIGLLISGFAVSFGGPFWFDVLRKFYTNKI